MAAPPAQFAQGSHVTTARRDFILGSLWFSCPASRGSNQSRARQLQSNALQPFARTIKRWHQKLADLEAGTGRALNCKI
jgi:hypothetical protein